MNLERSSGIREFWIEPPELNNKNSKSSIWVESNDFYCFSQGDSEISQKSHESTHYVLVGFDTEFKTPSVPLSPSEVKEEGIRLTRGRTRRNGTPQLSSGGRHTVLRRRYIKKPILFVPERTRRL